MRFCVHLLAWLVFLFIPVLVGPPEQGATWAWKEQLLAHGGMVLMLAGFYYWNNLRLVPRYLLPGRTGRYALIVAGAFLLYIACQALVVASTGQARPFPGGHSPPPALSMSMRLVPAIIFFVVAALWSGLQTIAGAWRKAQALRQESEYTLVQAELSQLRAQVDPHFFFNALNVIYGLAELKDERTAQATLHLGRLMRNIMEAPKRPLIPLLDEMEHLRAYIAFQELRSTGPPVKFAVKGIEEGMQITPLLLMPLVENAFKHGPTSCQDKATTIQVIGHGQKKLILIVTNIIGPGTPPASGGGLGLANLRRRLSLEYPGAHTLSTGRVGQRFNAWLRIELDHAVHST